MRAADPLERLRRQAVEVLRAASAARRGAERDLERSAEDLRRVVLAAVEGLEALTDALAGLEAELPPAALEVVRLSSRASWERLAAAGIALDGEVGEPVDLSRHRVLKAVRAPERRPGTVAAVVTPGVTFDGVRIREAVVWVAEER